MNTYKSWMYWADTIDEPRYVEYNHGAAKLIQVLADVLELSVHAKSEVSSIHRYCKRNADGTWLKPAELEDNIRELLPIEQEAS